VAEALRVLPQLDDALRTASLSWSAVRELSRVAVPENERAWIDCARGKTLWQIEQLVAGRRKGDGPEDRRDASLTRHVLRFEVGAETLAVFREAMTKLRRETPGLVGDDSALLLMARQVLEGPSDPGRANYQVALTLCTECGRGWQQGGGELIEVGREIVEMAKCDAQHIGSVQPSAPPNRDSLPPQAMGPRAGEARGNPPVQHAMAESVHVGAASAGQPNSPQAVPSAHVGAANAGQPNSPQAVPSAHVGAHIPATNAPSAVASVPPRVSARVAGPYSTAAATSRAKQAIPPAIRRLVMRRDQGRCSVIGCSSRVFVDIHHLNPRAEGGARDPDSLICLCGAHHRAVHRGQLLIAGRVSSGLVFRHADGSAYGGTVSPEVADTQTRVFRMLRGLGFRETESRRALEHVRAEARVDHGDTQQVLRAALVMLTASVRAA
jgi:hypothetical protein